MQIKNMGYSPSQLIELIEQLDSVARTSTNTFAYKKAILKVESLASLPQFAPYLSKEDNARLSIKSPILPDKERSLLIIDGNPQDGEEFYMKFLLNCLTIGG